MDFKLKFNDKEFETDYCHLIPSVSHSLSLDYCMIIAVFPLKGIFLSICAPLYSSRQAWVAMTVQYTPDRLRLFNRDGGPPSRSVRMGLCLACTYGGQNVSDQLIISALEFVLDY